MNTVNVEAEALKCMFCGFCEAVCPTIRFSPHRGHGPRGRLVAARLAVKGLLSGEAVASLYTCLLCGACRLACPAGIDVPLLVRAARQAIARAWRNR